MAIWSFHTDIVDRTSDAAVTAQVILYSVQCCYALHWTDNKIVNSHNVFAMTTVPQSSSLLLLLLLLLPVLQAQKSTMKGLLHFCTAKVSQTTISCSFITHHVTVTASHFLITEHTRSSATAENSAAAAHMYLGWLTDLLISRLAVHCTEHGRIAEAVLFFTFKRSDSKSSDRKRILTWNIHSRWFKVIHFAISYRHTIGCVSL